MAKVANAITNAFTSSRYSPFEQTAMMGDGGGDGKAERMRTAKVPEAIICRWGPQGSRKRSGTPKSPPQRHNVRFCLQLRIDYEHGCNHYLPI